MNVTKHQLENLYVGQGLTVRQCAAALGLPTSGGISWRLKKFGIPARPQLQVDKFHGGAHPREKHRVTVLCMQCGEHLKKYPSKTHDKNFCNHACKGEWRRQNLSGKRFGLLTVVRMGERDRWNHIQWECLCDCGGKKTTRTANLLNGSVASCGCLNHKTGKANPRWKGGKIDIKCANPSCRKMKCIWPSQDGIYEKRFCGAKCYGEYISSSGVRSGEKNPLWQGGASLGIYPATWNFRLREAIRDRDGRTCQICGMAENGKKLAVHHIDYDKKNIAPRNLISLCHLCHCKTNSKRDYWQAFFEEQREVLKTGTNN